MKMEMMVVMVAMVVALLRLRFLPFELHLDLRRGQLRNQHALLVIRRGFCVVQR